MALRFSRRFLLLILLPKAIAQAPDTLRHAKRSFETASVCSIDVAETTQDM
jgi:hypothetical protein